MELTVQLGPRSYPIIIEQNISDSLPAILKKQFPRSRFAIITNTTIEQLYRKKINSWMQQMDCKLHAIPDGEQYKTLDTWKEILDFLIQSKFERSSIIIALGGGVVGDITGFAASAFLRGVSFVQIPTTLLAMVDSSVGGKTAVDHPSGKNLIGAFNQPKMVIVDTLFLDTLPQREFISGYAELFKYGFIGGKPMFDFIDNNNEAMLNKSQSALLEGIKRSIEIKANIVEQDEFETKGLRALLNFGHTFAHSLERYFNFSQILHGEAVLWGIKCAVELGKRIKSIESADYQNYDSLVDRMPLPEIPAISDFSAIYDMMFTDKKVESGKINFVIPAGPGESVVKGDIAKEVIVKVLERVFRS